MTRIQRLKKMHEIVKNLNNENYYYNDWITVFPDEPDETDFEFAAFDEDSYNEVLETFVKIIIKAIKEGVIKNEKI